jgi:hypothetical protein
MKILFDGYLMKRGHLGRRKDQTLGFSGNFAGFPADSYLMVI